MTKLITLLLTTVLFGAFNAHSIQAQQTQEQLPFEMMNKGKIVTYASFTKDNVISSYSRYHITGIEGDKNNGKIILEKHLYDAFDVFDSSVGVILDTIIIRKGDIVTGQAALMRSIMGNMGQVSAEVAQSDQFETPEEKKEAEEELNKVFESIEIEETEDIIPFNMEVGDELEEYKLKIKVMMFSTTMTLSDREVIKKETVEVPAGEFETYLVSSKMKTKALMKTETSYTSEWYARGIGVVKSENYNKKKELESFTLLLSIEDYRDESQLAGNPPSETEDCEHEGHDHCDDPNHIH